MPFAPEDQLILACSRTDMREVHRARAVDALRAGLDWSYVLDAAIRHAVAPLMCAGLEQLGDGDRPVRVPEPVWRELRALRRGSEVRNERLFQTIAQIATELASVDVAVLGLKDVQLAPDVYPELGLRPMGDVDLLVSRSDVPAAERALRSLGFQPVPDDRRPFSRRYGVGQQHRRAVDETWVDLQWHVSEREWDRFGDGVWAYDMEGMWSRAVPLSSVAADLLAPSPADMLLHLCLHLEGHEYCELVLFCDLVEFVRHYGSAFDWDAFVELSVSTRSSSAVHGALQTATRVLGLEVPGTAMERLRTDVFEAALYVPLFGNLTSLHQSLDDLQATVQPPAEALDVAERSVRAQAALASRAFAEVGALTGALADRSGRPVLIHAGRATRWFPAPAVPELQPVDVFVLPDDTAALREALSACGFSVEAGDARKRAVLAPRDPILRGMPLELELVVDVRARSRMPIAPRRESRSTRHAAVRAMRRSAQVGTGGTRLSVTVHVLEPAALAATALARVGAAVETVLFAAQSASSVLQLLSDLTSGTAVEHAAREAGLVTEVRRGLSVLDGLGAPFDAVTPDALEAQRVLEWARYGPGALDRRPELRDAFAYVQGGMLLPHGRRLRYLAMNAMPWMPGGRALARAFAATLRRLRPYEEPLDATAFAYWAQPVYDLDVEPVPAAEAEARLGS